MAVFAAAKEINFMQDMMLLAVRHSSSLFPSKDYRVMRNKLPAVEPKPTFFDGQIGGRWLTQEGSNSFKHYTIPMSNAAVGLEHRLDEDLRLARTVAGRFGPVTAKHFKVTHFANLKFPTDEELAAMRQAPNIAD